MRTKFWHTAIAAVLAAAASISAAAQQLPAPGVPALPAWKLIPRTAKSVPMSTVVFAAPQPLNTVPLDKYGYIEEEYFISGTANVYAEPDHQSVAKPDLPYTTRILVRRPANAARFSGTVHLEPIRDLTEWYTTWLKAWPYFVRHGDVWIGFTMSKENVADFLQKYDAERYRPINIQDNGQRWDIMAQVAGLARSNDGPLDRAGFIARAASVPGGLKVYSSGWSLTGCMQVTFINDGHHARARTPSGGPVIDGYLPGICPRGAKVKLPDDAPVIQMMSENEYAEVFFPHGGAETATARQPQRDGNGPRFRWYDLAGTSHIDHIDLPDLSVVWTQMGMQVGLHTQCPQPISEVASKEHLVPAALAGLDQWVRSGKAPSPSQTFKLNDDGTIARDSDGNAIGGVRTHWVAVPTARVVSSTAETAENAAHQEPPPRGGICKFLTHLEPFSPERSAALYQSDSDYKRKASDAINSLVKSGLLLPEEASQEKAALH